MSSRTTSTRFTRRGIITAALAAGLVLAAPAAASAHVGVSPDTVEPDGSADLTFAFTHGCEESPTTSLRITMPEGLASVAPTVDSNWEIAVEHADNGLVSAVTYTAVTPVPSGLQATASMSVRLGEDAPESLVFPVVQQCESGVNEWVEVAEDGADPHDLDSPAPVVTVTGDADTSSDAAHGDHADQHDPADQQSTADTAATIDPLGTTLGAAGLVAAVAALIVAIVAYRRSA
ncbi:YcnI family protein [Microbacterium sp.]|uniref:YcnI family protein n=1 Tax=Microbacterium sp. TaxID=51671 RepID=UPI0026372196|nr:YcnI family protein [Microbacterium sp.]